MSSGDVRVVVPEQHAAVDALTTATGVEVGAAAERAEDATVLVAVQEETVLGTATLHGPDPGAAGVAGPSEVELSALVVDPAHRRRGVGEALVRTVLGEAVELGATAVVVVTEPDADDVRALCRRLGFDHARSRDQVRPDGSTAQVLARAL